MKRLRHPISAIREPFGTAGLIVACIALIAALAGGAYAASGLNGKQKKEVEKISKKFAGKPGPAGAAGAAGPQGAAGANGKDGATGVAGKDGKSVVVTEIPVDEEACEGLGGAEVETEGAGSPVNICTGEEGSPWTLGGTVPKGKTLTGTWSAYVKKEETGHIPISFPLPVVPAPTPSYVESGTSTDCPGVVNGVPTAKPGKLCLYSYTVPGGEGATGEETTFFRPYGPFAEAIGAAGPTGAEFVFECGSTSQACIRIGTWAVTAS